MIPPRPSVAEWVLFSCDLWKQSAAYRLQRAGGQEGSDIVGVTLNLCLITAPATTTSLFQFQLMKNLNAKVRD